MDRLDELFELLKSTLDRVEKLEGNFHDLLGAVDDARNEYDTNERRAGFRERNSSAFEKYHDKLRAIEGDDFDVVDKAFEEYDGMKDKISEADYIAALCAKIDQQLSRIAEAYGVPKVEAEHEHEGGEETTTIKEEDGEKIAEVTGEETHEAPKPDEEAQVEAAVEGVAEEVEEAKKEEEKEAESEEDDLLVEEEDEELIDTAEEIEADLRELEEEMKKYR